MYKFTKFIFIFFFYTQLKSMHDKVEEIKEMKNILTFIINVQTYTDHPIATQFHISIHLYLSLKFPTKFSYRFTIIYPVCSLTHTSTWEKILNMEKKRQTNKLGRRNNNTRKKEKKSNIVQVYNIENVILFYFFFFSYIFFEAL